MIARRSRQRTNSVLNGTLPSVFSVLHVLRPNVPAKIMEAATSSKPVHAAKQRLLTQEKMELAKAKAKSAASGKKPKSKPKPKAKAKQTKGPGKSKKAKPGGVQNKPAGKPGPRKAPPRTGFSAREASWTNDEIKTRRDEEAAWKASEARQKVLASSSTFSGGGVSGRQFQGRGTLRPNGAPSKGRPGAEPGATASRDTYARQDASRRPTAPAASRRRCSSISRSMRCS